MASRASAAALDTVCVDLDAPGWRDARPERVKEPAEACQRGEFGAAPLRGSTAPLRRIGHTLRRKLRVGEIVLRWLKEYTLNKATHRSLHRQYQQLLAHFTLWDLLAFEAALNGARVPRDPFDFLMSPEADSFSITEVQGDVEDTGKYYYKRG